MNACFIEIAASTLWSVEKHEWSPDSRFSGFYIFTPINILNHCQLPSSTFFISQLPRNGWKSSALSTLKPRWRESSRRKCRSHFQLQNYFSKSSSSQKVRKHDCYFQYDVEVIFCFPLNHYSMVHLFRFFVCKMNSFLTST